MKKVLLVVLFVNICFMFWGCAKNNDKTEADLNQQLYQEALQKYNAHDYENAYETFEKLGDYQDSGELANECYYVLAEQKMESGNYSDAIEAFEKLGDYKDSEQNILKCKYNIASEFIKNGEYEKARKLLSEIDGKINVLDLTQLLKYEEGKKLFHQKKIGEALKQFKEIVEYGDTNTYIYKIGCKFLKNKKYRKAANIFGMILNYKDAKKMCKNAKLNLNYS